MQIETQEIKEIIKSYIKENLQVKVSTTDYYDYDNTHGIKVEVQVLMDDEVLISDEDRLPFPCSGGYI